MANEFDPYVEWLKISEPSRPVSHYSLLDIEKLESDPQRISTAAKNRVGMLQKLRLGPQREVAQRLIGEVMAAAACLTDPNSKAEYDQRMGFVSEEVFDLTALSGAAAIDRADEQAAIERAAEQAAIDRAAERATSAKAGRRNPTQSGRLTVRPASWLEAAKPYYLLGGAAGGVLIVAGLLAYGLVGRTPDLADTGSPNQPKQQEQATNPEREPGRTEHDETTPSDRTAIGKPAVNNAAENPGEAPVPRPVLNEKMQETQAGESVEPKNVDEQQVSSKSSSDILNDVARLNESTKGQSPQTNSSNQQAPARDQRAEIAKRQWAIVVPDFRKIEKAHFRPPATATSAYNSSQTEFTWKDKTQGTTGQFGFSVRAKDKVDLLDGVGVTMYPEGQLRSFGNYKMGDRTQTFLAFSEDGATPVLLCNYIQDKPHGAVCICEDGLPVIVQQRTNGQISKEYLVKVDAGQLVVAPKLSLEASDLDSYESYAQSLSATLHAFDEEHKQIQLALRLWGNALLEKQRKADRIAEEKEKAAQVAENAVKKRKETAARYRAQDASRSQEVQRRANGGVP